MRTLIDFADAPVFAVPLLDASGQHRVREGMLIEGPQGWGEFGPDPDVTDHAALTRWLTAAVEAGTVGWPDPVRGRVAVSVPVPAVDASDAARLASRAGCRVADVAVGTSPQADVARVTAVRDALGPDAVIRCNAFGRWNIDQAAAAIAALDRAAGGLQFVQRPCATRADAAAVRSRVDVAIAMPAWPHPADDAHAPRLTEAADIAVLAAGPLGGVRRALRVAQTCGLPSVVSSAVQSSVGLAGGLALAGVLPELPYACDLGTRLLLDADLVAPSRTLVPVDGHLPVAPMPPAPDPGLVAKYAITDPARVTWWRKRLADSIGGM